MRTPDLFTLLVDDGVLVRVDIIGKGTGGCSPKMWEKFVLSVEGDDREGELLEERSRWSGRGDNGNGGFDNGRQEVLNWDVRKWDTVDDFLELKVDVSVLGFIGRGTLELQA